MLTNKEIKGRYFDKVYNNALEILCSCGCGETIKNKDRFGRDKKFINGHNGRKYDNPTQYKREWNHRNRMSRLESKIKRGRILKSRVVDICGGKCINCNLSYNQTNACVFQLHHRNPKNKLFIINTRTLVNYSWKKILLELKKCDLLCANCHFIIHNEKY